MNFDKSLPSDGYIPFNFKYIKNCRQLDPIFTYATVLLFALVDDFQRRHNLGNNFKVNIPMHEIALHKNRLIPLTLQQ